MNENKNRATFQSRLGFILVSAGCAIGLGNVWKFPYICGQNGGGAFLFLYLICLVLLGLPILICEFAIGRGSNRSLSQAFNRLEKPGSRYHCTKYTSIAGNYLLMMFYTMVTGWMLYYAFKYATGSLDASSTAATAEAFKDMQASPWLMLIFSAIVIILCIGVCALGLQNGIEKVTKFMMILLMALMVVLAVNSIRLKGASEGLKFFLVPDFDVFKEKGFTSVLFAAMTQAFFTLSIGIGTMEIFGSYLKKDRTLVGESVNVIVLDTAVAVVAGLIIIPACFAYGIEPDSGPSLLFITLPNVFHHMASSRLWGIFFFIFMSFAALSTVIAVFENIITMSVELWDWSRKKSLIVNLVMILVLTMPAVFGFNLLKISSQWAQVRLSWTLKTSWYHQIFCHLALLWECFSAFAKTAGAGRTSSRKPTLARESISLTDFAATWPTLCLHLYASSILKATMTHFQTEVCLFLLVGCALR